MKIKLYLVTVIIILNSSLLSGFVEAQKLPPELYSGKITYKKILGIGEQAGVERQDPSNVLKIGDRYFVWYTQRKAGTHPYASTIYYATSKDGIAWKDQGQALDKGVPGSWDSFGVITPYIAFINNKYYLFYTGTGDEHFRGDLTLRHIGIAVSNNPRGPWSRYESNPILGPGISADSWDAVLVDDAHLIKRDNKYWLYYKGRNHLNKPSETKWGVAFAKKPEGPYVKFNQNPIVDSAHTVCVWPHRKGVAALVDITNTIQYAEDGIHFKVVKELNDVETGCGPYDPNAFTGAKWGNGISWGVAQYEPKSGGVYIVRFDCNFIVP